MQTNLLYFHICHFIRIIISMLLLVWCHCDDTEQKSCKLTVFFSAVPYVYVQYIAEPETMFPRVRWYYDETVTDFLARWYPRCYNNERFVRVEFKRDWVSLPRSPLSRNGVETRQHRGKSIRRDANLQGCATQTVDSTSRSREARGVSAHCFRTLDHLACTTFTLSRQYARKIHTF